MNDNLTKASLSLRLGVCFVSMATVLLELLITRILSASAGYHFAFMIVSMAMFGMTAGALYAFAQRKNNRPLPQTLVLLSSAFAFSLPIAYVGQEFATDAMKQLGPYMWIALTFVLYSIPFYFSGTCITLCLTRFGGVGNTYAADLIGAGFSCPLLIIGLTYTDAHTMMVGAGLLAVLAAFCFWTNIIPKHGISFCLPIIAGIFNLLVLMLPQHISLPKNLALLNIANGVPWDV